MRKKKEASQKDGDPTTKIQQNTKATMRKQKGMEEKESKQRKQAGGGRSLKEK